MNVIEPIHELRVRGSPKNYGTGIPYRSCCEFAVRRITNGHRAKMPIMSFITAGVLYFAIVFGVGFVLGTIRTLWIVPRLGTRTAELLEAPIMLLVSFLAARWVIRLVGLPYLVSSRVGMGLLALILMVVAEFSMVLRLRGLSIRQYVATRDPISGTAYYVSLALFTIMPLIVDLTI